MSEDPIQRLRRADPVRDGGHAAAYEDARAYVHQNAEAAGSRRAPRLWIRPSILVPMIAVAAVVGVVAVFLRAGGTHRPAPASRPSPAGTAAGARVPSPASLLSGHGGMRGLVFGVTVTGAGSTLRASFTQCTNCGDSTGPHARDLYWSTKSTDGGVHWLTTRQQTLLLTFGVALPEGRDVWQSGYPPHPSNPDFYVSHNDGRTFHVVRAPATASGIEPVALGGGQAWTLGERCQHGACASSVLTGPAAGSSLTPTVAQPPGMPKHQSPSLLLVTGYGPRGYVSQPSTHRLYATEDRGRSWAPVASPCSAGASILHVSATADRVVWATCGRIMPSKAPLTVTVRRSDDGGASWQTPSRAFHAAGDLAPASPEVAWAESSTGTVVRLSRTTNGGRSWQTVLKGANADAAISIQGAPTATVIAPATIGSAKAHNRRTDLIAYRTTTAGARWSHTVIRLPAR